MTRPDDTVGEHRAPAHEAPHHRPVRWYQRVVPVTSAVLLLVAVATLAFPSFRTQVELSLTRQSDPYVEVYFARSVRAGGQAVCARSGASVEVRFVVASHLERARGVAYRVAVDPAGSGRTVRARSAVKTVPGQVSGVRRTFTLRAQRGYTVSVTLPGMGQQIRGRCAGGRS